MKVEERLLRTRKEAREKKRSMREVKIGASRPDQHTIYACIELS